MSSAVAKIMDHAQFRLAEAPPLDAFIQVARRDPCKLSDIIGGKPGRERSQDIPVELKVGERCHIC